MSKRGIIAVAKYRETLRETRTRQHVPMTEAVSEIDFYKTERWLKLRYEALWRSDGHCECCGHPGTPEKPLQVDHIKPRSRYPELEFVLSNLQVLCKQCNLGKGADDETDWRLVTQITPVRFQALFQFSPKWGELRQRLLKQSISAASKDERLAARDALEWIDCAAISRFRRRLRQ
jgi:5-methylcytosine-specific restriction endonuclease McrA